MSGRNPARSRTEKFPALVAVLTCMIKAFTQDRNEIVGLTHVHG